MYKPEEIYCNVCNIAPDLIVQFGGLHWRSIEGVGYPALHVRENDNDQDQCNNAQFGAFVLAAPNSPLSGEISDARVLDIAPTLLELAGYEIPSSMQGRTLASGKAVLDRDTCQDDSEAERLVRERLSGLGYI